MSEQLDVDVSFTDESPDSVREVLEGIGAENVAQLKQRGLTGVEVAIVATLAAQALANLAIRLLPLWKCGVVLDLRGSRIVTTKNCELPRGTVLVLSRNGTESKLHQPSELQINSLIGDLIK